MNPTENPLIVAARLNDPVTVDYGRKSEAPVEMPANDAFNLLCTQGPGTGGHAFRTLPPESGRGAGQRALAAYTPVIRAFTVHGREVTIDALRAAHQVWATEFPVIRADFLGAVADSAPDSPPDGADVQNGVRETLLKVRTRLQRAEVIRDGESGKASNEFVEGLVAWRASDKDTESALAARREKQKNNAGFERYATGHIKRATEMASLWLERPQAIGIAEAKELHGEISSAADALRYAVDQTLDATGREDVIHIVSARKVARSIVDEFTTRAIENGFTTHRPARGRVNVEGLLNAASEGAMLTGSKVEYLEQIATDREIPVIGVDEDAVLADAVEDFESGSWALDRIRRRLTQVSEYHDEISDRKARETLDKKRRRSPRP